MNNFPGKSWAIQTRPDNKPLTHNDRKFSSASLLAAPSALVPAVGQAGNLVEGAPDNVAVILLTMVALIMLLMMLAEYVDPSEILRSSKHHMVIIEGWSSFSNKYEQASLISSLEKKCWVVVP